MVANPDDLDGARPLPPVVKRVKPRLVLRPWVEFVRDLFLAALFVTPRAPEAPDTAEVNP